MDSIRSYQRCKCLQVFPWERSPLERPVLLMQHCSRSPSWPLLVPNWEKSSSRFVEIRKRRSSIQCWIDRPSRKRVKGERVKGESERPLVMSSLPFLPLTPSPLTPSPLIPSPLTPSPLTPSPLTPSPLTPSPLTPSPLTLPLSQLQIFLCYRRL